MENPLFIFPHFHFGGEFAWRELIDSIHTTPRADRFLTDEYLKRLDNSIDFPLLIDCGAVLWDMFNHVSRTVVEQSENLCAFQIDPICDAFTGENALALILVVLREIIRRVKRPAIIGAAVAYDSTVSLWMFYFYWNYDHWVSRGYFATHVYDLCPETGKTTRKSLDWDGEEITIAPGQYPCASY